MLFSILVRPFFDNLAFQQGVKNICDTKDRSTLQVSEIAPYNWDTLTTISVDARDIYFLAPA